MTVDHWKIYDLTVYLKTNWNMLKPNLEGKIRVSVGNRDNFLLNYAVHLLEDEMKKLDAKFIFAYYPGDHFTVSSPDYRTSGGINSFNRNIMNSLTIKYRDKERYLLFLPMASYEFTRLLYSGKGRFQKSTQLKPNNKLLLV